ncbi:MAG: helix-hairpin-helix domain-containing protein [Gemmatimonadales bacterium]|nr:MAG: helix-hairpin-helix domain-containing protein [Gemmatimonadales bacterium]
MLTQPRFLVVPVPGEGYRFVLQATNSAIVLKGALRPTRAASRADVAAVRSALLPQDPGSPLATVVGRTVFELEEPECGPYFAVANREGTLIAFSECYASRFGARAALGRLQNIFLREREGAWTIQALDRDAFQSADNWPDPPAFFQIPGTATPAVGAEGGCGPVGGGLSRPRYFDRQQLRAEDLTLEQQYLDRRLRRLTRYLHGWGMVAGGVVGVDGERMVVTEGYGITPLGDEIYIPAGTEWSDFRGCLEARCGMGGGGGCDDPEGVDPTSPHDGSPGGAPDGEGGALRAWVVARPHTAVMGHAPSFPDDCGHPGNHTRVNRVCETFRLDIVCSLEAPHLPDPLPCEAVQALVCWGTSGGPAGTGYPVALPPPDVPEALNYLVLAELRIEDGEVRGVSQAARRRLLPVEVLQRRLECLCHSPPVTTEPPATTAPPTTTRPPMGTVTLIPYTTLPPIGTATLIPYTTLPPIGTATLIPYTTRPPIVTMTMIPYTTGIIGPGGSPGGTLFPDDPLGPFTRPIDGGILGGGGRIVVVNEPGGGLVAGGGLPGAGGVVAGGGPRPQGTPVDALDPLVFDVAGAGTRSLDSLDFLDAEQLDALAEAGITSVRGLLETENARLIGVLDSSDVAAAEIKLRATESLRRSQPLDLDREVFDVARGAAEPVEAVSGIGPARSAALREGGIGSVAELATASPDEVSGLLGLSREVVEGMIGDARGRMTR